MIRKDKEITDRSEIEAIIEKSSVCRLGFGVSSVERLADEEYPYIVPLCFGYDGDSLYFHSAKEGKKLDLIRKNNRVCFEFDTGYEIKTGEKACDWGMKYKSVIGFGEASFVEAPESKRRALDIIMRQYSGIGPFEYSDAKLKITAVIKVDIRGMTGKCSK